MSTTPAMVSTNFYPTSSNSSGSGFNNTNNTSPTNQALNLSSSPYLINVPQATQQVAVSSNPSSSSSPSSSAAAVAAAAAASLQAFQDNCFSDYSSSLLSSNSSSSINSLDTITSGTAPATSAVTGSDVPKPFSLPSLSSIIKSSSPSSEASLFGPHRQAQNLANPTARRFSPLSTSIDSHDLISPLDSERSGFSWSDRRMSASGAGPSITAGHRPRSRSILSGYSISSVIQPESDLMNDESASDSGSSEKKKDCEEGDLLSSSKKRSRTLTTPSQQRRLMQILEQTRFPSTDLREQLARELGMTPRRVQIWFQNRRQGMKKAMEHKTDQDTAPSTGPDYGRARGYSFGAYPAPPSDVYAQARSSAQQSFGSGPISAYNNSSMSHSSQGTVDPYGGTQLYASRTLARSSMPRQLAQLQLVTNPTPNSNESTAGGDFAWSESSGASTAYSLSSAADRETACPPFGKGSSGSYDNSNSTNFGTPQPVSRNRSQTNPGFFVTGGLSGLHGIGHLSNHATGSALNASGSRPVQRFATFDSDSTPSKMEDWSSNYSQPVWQEEMRDLKLDSAGYSGSGNSSGQQASSQASIYPSQTQAHTGLYYPSDKAPSPGGLSQMYSLNQRDSSNVEGFGSSMDEGATDIAAAQQIRQRSRSFTG